MCILSPGPQGDAITRVGGHWWIRQLDLLGGGMMSWPWPGTGRVHLLWDDAKPGPSTVRMTAGAHFRAAGAGGILDSRHRLVDPWRRLYVEITSAVLRVVGVHAIKQLAPEPTQALWHRPRLTINVPAIARWGNRGRE